MSHARLVSLVALLFVTAFAQGQAPDACCPAGTRAWCTQGCRNVLGQRYHCPNDYCEKDMPRTCSICKFGKNDYCEKDMPRTCSICKFGKNDYCEKVPPCVRIFCAPWYSCGAKPACPGVPVKGTAE